MVAQGKCYVKLTVIIRNTRWHFALARATKGLSGRPFETFSGKIEKSLQMRQPWAIPR